MVHPSRNEQHSTSLLGALSTYIFCNNRKQQLDQDVSSSLPPHFATKAGQRQPYNLETMRQGTDGNGEEMQMEDVCTFREEHIVRQSCSFDLENPHEKNEYQVQNQMSRHSSQEIIPGRQSDYEVKEKCNGNDIDLEEVSIDYETTINNRPRLQIKVDEFSDNPQTRDTNMIASPTIRPDHFALPYSPRFMEANCISKEQGESKFAKLSKEHVTCCHHGVFRTIFTVMMAIAALSFSVACKQSTNFARLGIPMSVGVHYKDVTKMGLFYMELCREEQSVSIDYTNNIVTILSFRYNDGDSIADDPKETVVTQLTKSEYTMRIRSQNSNITSQELSEVCQKIRLKQDMVGDGIWNFTRIFAGITEWIGGFITCLLITSFFWKTMNLIPICAGLFVTYFCQSLSFFFYESKLCKDNGCHHSEGSALALSAIIFWFLSWVGVLNMILHASHKKRMAQLIEKKKSVAAVIYDTKMLKRAQSFMINQISFLRLFSSSTRVNQSVSATSDSSDATSESIDDDYVSERFEI